VETGIQNKAQCALDTRLRGYDGFRYDGFTGLRGFKCLERRATPRPVIPVETGDPEQGAVRFGWPRLCGYDGVY
jgi:hypothetical protein